MSQKVKYTVEQKVKAAEKYLRGEASAAGIAAEMGMPASGKRRVREWAAAYRENGIEGFHLTKGNRSYTGEEKQQAVEDYLQGKGSLCEISRKYHIPSNTTLRQSSWSKDQGYCCVRSSPFSILFFSDFFLIFIVCVPADPCQFPAVLIT